MFTEIENISGAVQIIFNEKGKRILVKPGEKIGVPKISYYKIAELLGTHFFKPVRKINNNNTVIIFLAISPVCKKVFDVVKKSPLLKDVDLFPITVHELRKPSPTVVNFLIQLKPKLLITLNESAKSMRYFIKKVREYLPKTKILLLEHGIIDHSSLRKVLDPDTNYKSFQPILSDYVASFSEFTRKKILKLNPTFPKKRIRVTGYPILDKYKNKTLSKRQREKNKTILFVSSPRVWFNNEREKDIWATRNIMQIIPDAFPDYNLVVRFKDYRDAEPFIRRVKFKGKATLSNEEPIEQALAKSTVVLSIYSTVCCEAGFMRIPVAKIDYNRIKENPNLYWNVFNRHQLVPVTKKMLKATNQDLGKQYEIVTKLAKMGNNSKDFIKFIKDILDDNV